MSQCYEFNYTSNQPQLLPDVWIPCPVGDNCCIGTDLCLSNNVCHYVGSSSKSKRDATYSGYYNARCTDPTYTSPACDKICVGWPPDIVYNYTSDLWACCGNNTAGQVSCSNPQHEYYEAPAPGQLATLSSGAVFASTQTLIPYDTRTSSTSSSDTSAAMSTSATANASTTSISSTSSATSVPVDSKDSGLSTGAKAGIGVGVAVAVIFLSVAVFFWTRRRNRKHRAPIIPARAELYTHNGVPVEKRRVPSEVPGSENERKAELDSKVYRAPVELAQP